MSPRRAERVDGGAASRAETAVRAAASPPFRMVMRASSCTRVPLPAATESPMSEGDHLPNLKMMSEDRWIFWTIDPFKNLRKLTKSELENMAVEPIEPM